MAIPTKMNLLMKTVKVKKMINWKAIMVRKWSLMIKITNLALTSLDVAHLGPDVVQGEVDEEALLLTKIPTKIATSNMATDSKIKNLKELRMVAIDITCDLARWSTRMTLRQSKLKLKKCERRDERNELRRRRRPKKRHALNERNWRLKRQRLRLKQMRRHV